MRRLIQLIFISALVIAMQSVCLGAASAQQANILIFVSFSMPEVSIKGWMNEAEKIGAPVVIRGLVNNSFKATIQKMTELARDNHGGVQLDPTLFQKYQINQVPAVVVTTTEDTWPNETPKEYIKVYGDVHLDYALKKIADQKGEAARIAERMLIRLRENHNA
jgi:conjugal transfer pilus assembly protein TrbC